MLKIKYQTTTLSTTLQKTAQREPSPTQTSSLPTSTLGMM